MPRTRKTPSQDPLEPLKKDFRKFLWLVWKELNLPEPTPIQYDIASYLQHGPKRSIVEAFRGVGKSWITSAYVAWLLLGNPQLKILVVSASKTRSDDFSIFVKRILSEIQVLNHLLPKSNQRNSSIAFDVGPARADHSPSVKSVGITGQLTGSRADVIVADDIEVLNNSATQTMRDKLAELVKEFDAVLKPHDDTKIVFLGTPQTEMSIYNTLAERGYEVRVWPALVPNADQRIKYGHRLAPIVSKTPLDQAGKPTDPKRFTQEDLQERRISYGAAGFSLQFMLDTSLSDADKYPLRTKDLVVLSLDRNEGPEKIVWGPDPETKIEDIPNFGLPGDGFWYPMGRGESTKEYTGSVMFIDPSGRGKDETAWAVVKHLHGSLFCTEIGASAEGYSDETMKRLVDCAKRNKVNLVLIESNFGDGMFDQLLKPWLTKLDYSVTVEGVRHSTQKEPRIIDTLEPLLGQHRLVISREVIEWDAEHAVDPQYSLFYQMTRVTRERKSLRHDDRLEALAGACAYWVESMAIERDQAAAKAKAKVLDGELKRFLKAARRVRPDLSRGRGKTTFMKTNRAVR